VDSHPEEEDGAIRRLVQLGNAEQCNDPAEVTAAMTAFVAPSTAFFLVHEATRDFDPQYKERVEAKVHWGDLSPC
jgi:hypothetical protein